MEDLGLDVPFRCEQGRFRTAGGDVGAPELTLRARMPDYLHLLAGQCDTDTLFFQRKLVISGDTALGLEVKYWLDAARDRPGSGRWRNGWQRRSCNPDLLPSGHEVEESKAAA